MVLDDGMNHLAPQELSERERLLLLSIARCPLMTVAVGDSRKPCHDVVNVQRHAEASRQVPEGWAGNLRGARVVFLSSNPAISIPADTRSPETAEAYPVASCSDEDIAQYLGRRFDQAVVPRPFVRDSRHLQLDGQYAARPTHFWVSMHRRAIELLGPDADPSRNYVMTEVVHCKSSGETGVATAARTCAERYLGKILCLTAAPVVVIVGRQAHATLKLWLPELCEPPYLCTKELGGRPRELVFIWHPASRKKGKTIAGLHGAESRDRLKAIAMQPLPQL
jgi:hypothetical protein